MPPQPPVGTELAMAHRPDETTWTRKEDGWHVSGWLLTQPQWPKGWCEVWGGNGPLVVVKVGGDSSAAGSPRVQPAVVTAVQLGPSSANARPSR